MIQFPRSHILPPPDRPKWIGGEGSVLRYLSWGKRFYCKNPIPMTRHTGWVYLFILSGSPTIHLVNKRIKLTPNTLFVMGPDCPQGWSDAPGSQCEVLAWIWDEPPRPEMNLRNDQIQIATARAATRTQLQRLHSACRWEVEAPDVHSRSALRSLRSLLDIEYLRTFQRKDSESTRDRLHFQLASLWMREHLNLESPVDAVTDYLQVSHVYLSRIFRKFCGESPSSHYYNLKMQRAEALIEEGKLAAKEIAWVLGYKQHADFSRAIRRHFGRSFREMRLDRVHPQTGAFQEAASQKAQPRHQRSTGSTE